VLPEAEMPLAELWPRQQEQSLRIDVNLLQTPTTTDFQGDVMQRTGIEGLEELDDATMLIVPDLMTPMPGQKSVDLNTIKAVQTLMIAHCEKMHDRVAILDAPAGLSPQAAKKWRMDIAGYDSSYAALYYPWIEVGDPVTNRPKLIPPSGHMAGVWARTDNTRGVHKAPANEVVRGATGLAYNVTKGEQDTLNPIGVNCIRAFPGMGIRIWGARTLSSNPSWRYINVRRLFNFVEKSIERGTQWVVFEPNDQFLWARVRRDISAFLTMVWSSGALFGAGSSEAFFVKCDAELNTQAVRDLGMLICEIGISPVKPAEFVIFRISQWSAGG
jgi:phage tail sheath protein FI